MKWKIIINNTNYNLNAKDQRFNWFLSNKKKYGALKWLTPRIIIAFSIIISILISTQFYSQLIANILDAILSFLCLPFLFILWCKTPIIEPNTNFHIGTELKYIIILSCVEWVFYFGGSIFKMIIFGDENGENLQYHDEITFMFIQSWTAVLYTFSIFIICTKWTLHKCNVDKRQTRRPSATQKGTNGTPSASVVSLPGMSEFQSHVHSSSTIIRSKPPHFNRKLSPISPRGRQLKLYECLQCNEGFNCFMNHLMGEFSHECLLSVIEFIQFKQGLCRSYTFVLGNEVANLPFTIHRSTASNSNTLQITNIKRSESSPRLIPIERTGNHLQAGSLESSKSLTLNSNNVFSPPVKSPSAVSPNMGHISLPLAHIQQGSEISCNLEDLTEIAGKISHSCSFEETDDEKNMNLQSPAPVIITRTSIISTTMSESSCNSSHTAHKREILTTRFPDCVPKSFIVFNKTSKFSANNDDDNDKKKKNNKNTNKRRNDEEEQNSLTRKDVIKEYKYKAYQLFTKYIHNPSNICEYEININYNMRKKLIDLMGDVDKWIDNDVNDDEENPITTFDQLYILWDECILEMYDLMCHSFQRWKKTQQFAKLDQKIFCKASFPDTFLN